MFGGRELSQRPPRAASALAPSNSRTAVGFLGRAILEFRILLMYMFGYRAGPRSASILKRGVPPTGGPRGPLAPSAAGTVLVLHAQSRRFRTYFLGMLVAVGQVDEDAGNSAISKPCPPCSRRDTPTGKHPLGDTPLIRMNMPIYMLLILLFFIVRKACPRHVQSHVQAMSILAIPDMAWVRRHVHFHKSGHAFDMACAWLMLAPRCLREGALAPNTAPGSVRSRTSPCRR